MPKKRSKPSNSSTLNQQILHIVKKSKPATVRDLVKLVQSKHSLPKEEIIESIINLQNQGKLILKDYQPPHPSTLSRYIFSRQAYWYWTIIALSAATTTLVFTIPEDAYPIVYARYLLGSIFVLALPGYSFIKALFPTKELDNIERAALSIGLSLALTPIVGLLLNYTPWGIRLTPVTLSLLTLTTTLATIALIRSYQSQQHQKETISENTAYKKNRE